MKRFALATLSLFATGLIAESACAQDLAVFQDPTPAQETAPVSTSLDERLKALEQEVELLKARPVPAAPKTPDPLGMNAKWNNGLELNSNDKAFKIHVGGRTQIDTVYWQNRESFNNTGGATDGDAVNFRRGRLRVDGTIYEIVEFAFEYDFTNQFNVNPGTPTTESNSVVVPAVTDAWVNFKEVPYVGNIKVGNIKDPIGMEHMTSSRFLEFMERSPIQDLFTGPFNNGFTPGIQINDTWDEEHGTWATGFFKNINNGFGNGYGDGEYEWASRFTYTPLYEEDGEYMIHLGLSGCIREPNNEQLRYRARPSLRNAAPGGLNPVFIDTTTFSATQQDVLGIELAGNYGSFSYQSEFMNSWSQDTTPGVGPLAGINTGTAHVYTWYVEGLYFLTGEHREYERKQGVFGRVKPHENFGWCKGIGAWQVGARYSLTDLRDSGIDGGRLQDVTLGLNWYLNPNMKIQTNYVYSYGNAPLIGAARGLDGAAHGVGTRLAIDF